MLPDPDQHCPSQQSPWSPASPLRHGPAGGMQGLVKGLMAKAGGASTPGGSGAGGTTPRSGNSGSGTPPGQSPRAGSEPGSSGPKRLASWMKRGSSGRRTPVLDVECSGCGRNCVGPRAL